MSQLILFAIVIVGIIALVKYFNKLENNRSENIARLSQQLGFQFEALPKVSHYENYQHFQLFSQGHGRKTKNLMSDRGHDKKSEIFGYQFSTGSGRNSSFHQHTVISFTNTAYLFPDFDLRPEHIFHRLGGVFGYQDIDFDSHPDFSKKYLLQGKNEASIRKLFNLKLLSFLEKNESFCLEARGNTVIVYQQHKRLEVEEIKKFYQRSEEIYSQLCLALGR